MKRRFGLPADRAFGVIRRERIGIVRERFGIGAVASDQGNCTRNSAVAAQIVDADHDCKFAGSGQFCGNPVVPRSRPVAFRALVGGTDFNAVDIGVVQVVDCSGGENQVASPEFFRQSDRFCIPGDSVVGTEAAELAGNGL